MTKRILLGILALGMLVACNNQNDKATSVTTAEFETVAANLLDQTVSIEGTVMHVCKHGGKKMFLNDDNVKIIASEKIGVFDSALEGSTVTVKGIVREEMVPVLTENEEAKHAQVVADSTNPEAKAEDCGFENTKPLYVIEVIEVTEKVQ